MKPEELQALAKALAPVIKNQVAELEKKLSDANSEIERLKSAIPQVDLDAIVAKAVAMIPKPENGKDGKDGADGKSVSVDELAAVFERRFSDLSLSWERQARDTFDKAADKMPIPKDGRDALSLKHFDAVLADDGRTLTLSLSDGETKFEKSIKLPTLIDKGVFSSDKEYEVHDVVTYGGSIWIAQKDSPEGAPGTSQDWRLSVKKGRDGKDYRAPSEKESGGVVKL